MNNKFNYYSRRNNKNNNKVKKILKDYMVPIIWWIILLLIIFAIFFQKADNNKNKTDSSKNTSKTTTWTVLVDLDTPDTKAYLVSGKSEKKLITSKINLWLNEKVIVNDWTINISNKDAKFRLNKLWELELQNNNIMKLISSDLWWVAKKDFDIDMNYAKLKIYSWTIFSLSQNEVISSVYVIAWSLEVSNLVWQKTLLWNWQTIMIQNQDASNKNIDLSISKDNIDNFFTSSDWYTKNKIDLFWDWSWSNLSWSTWTLNLTWTWKISTWRTSSNSVVELDDLRDEMVVSSNKINITWRYYSDFISSIKLDSVSAKLNLENKTFSFGQIDLTKKETDLVIKTYDSEDNIISKDVYTIYFNWTLPKSEVVQNQENNKNSSTNTTVIDSSKFIFTAPWKSPYKTTDSLVTIRWTVPKWLVEKIVVNWYTLQRYTKFSTDWRYHADINNWNFEEWTNTYEVKYYGEWWKLLYTNSFTVIKEAKVSE